MSCVAHLDSANTPIIMVVIAAIVVIVVVIVIVVVLLVVRLFRTVQRFARFGVAQRLCFLQRRKKNKFEHYNDQQQKNNIKLRLKINMSKTDQ